MTSILEFDHQTLENMIAALDYSYKKIPAGMDNAVLRKDIADAVAASAEKGMRSPSELNEAGLQVLNGKIFGDRKRR